MTMILRVTNAGVFTTLDPVFSVWTDDSDLTRWSEGGSAVVTRDITKVQTGEFSAKVEGNNGNDRLLQTIQVDKGEPLVFVLNVYVEAGGVRLRINDGVSPEESQTSGTGWQVIRTAITPASDSVIIELRISTTSSTVYIDRVLVATQEIDLVSGDSEFRLLDYSPEVPDYKGGGVFSSSPLASGSSLVQAVNQNIQQVATIRATGASQDVVEQAMEGLQLAFENAAEYNYGKYPFPYYLEYKPNEATNTLRALIVKGRIASTGNPFGVEYDGNHRLNLTVPMETGQWSELPPCLSKSIQIGNLETFDSEVFGNVDDSEDFDPQIEGVFVAPRRNIANISHAYYYDDSTATFSSNIQDHDFATSTALLPASVATDDVLYLGCQTSLTNSGVFASAVFDIETALGAAIGVTWEYWDGSAWSALTVEDKTNGLRNTGINAVSWIQPSDWATTSVNGVTGYWVRMVVGVGSTTTEPTQQNRRIYAVTWPSVIIPRSSVNGAVRALTNATLNHSGLSSISYDRAIMGYRSFHRGRNFTPVINMADEQNPSGVTITLYSDASFSMSHFTEEAYPCGRVVVALDSGAGDPLDEKLRVSLSSSISASYTGRFRIIGRVANQGITTDLQHKIVVKTSSGSSSESGVVVSDATVANTNQVIDFGDFDISTSQSDTIQIQWHIGAGAGANTYLVDLWLIPVDEMAVDVTSTALATSGVVAQDYSMSTSSINGKLPKSCFVFDDSGDVIARYQYIGNPITTNPNRRGELVVLPLSYDTSNGIWAWASHELVNKVTIQTNDQYKVGRGSA